MKTNFKNLIQLLDYFKDEETCKKLLELQRWNGKPTCPHCNNDKVYITNRGYKCANKLCYKKFSVTVGTIFENSKISLRYWFATIYLCTAHKKGISSHQLARDLGCTQKTAWFMLHRVREMLKEKAPQVLTGTVEVDETYIGGAEKNKHKRKKTANTQGRSVKTKTPIFGMMQREGNVIVTPVPNTDSKTLLPLITENIHADSQIYSDEWIAYRPLKNLYNHGIIKHGEGEFVSGNIHTNNLEGFWSLLKRGILGIYHHTSPQHLHRYCNEFGYRYNTKHLTDCDRFLNALNKTNNVRITYNQLILKDGEEKESSTKEESQSQEL